jgi:hypothetical protein
MRCCGTVYQTLGTPTLVDLDKDGSSEVVAMQEQNIYAWHKNGDLLSGFPVFVPGIWNGAGSLFSASHLAMGDIDNDGDLEIVLNTSKTIYGSSSDEEISTIYAYHHDGSLVQGFPAGPFPIDQISHGGGEIALWANFSPPAIADIDGDGKNDIVYTTGSWDLTSSILSALDGNGSVKPGWPVLFNGKRIGIGQGTPTVADVDNDGDKEIIGLYPDLSKAKKRKRRGSS